MIRILAIASTGLLLAACAHNPPPAPVSAPVSGPRFPAQQFDCDEEPLPPDPSIEANRRGKAAAKYEGGLRRWGRGCKAKLESTGRELDAAGQVVR